MGTFQGHLIHGFGIMVIGLWHLHNTCKSYFASPKHFTSQPWYPTKTRHLELYGIIVMTMVSIVMEMVVSPARHVPWSADGTIPLSHMNDVEHSSIAGFFMLYAVCALVADRWAPSVPRSAVYIVAAAAFVNEAVMFEYHSTTDREGVEGRYHSLLQKVLWGCVVGTLAESAVPGSAAVAAARAGAVVLQGLWLCHMGFDLWIPLLAPKGCSVSRRHGHGTVKVLNCHGSESTARALGLANLHFSLDFAIVVGVCFGFLVYHSSKQSKQAYCPLDLNDGNTKAKLPSHKGVEEEDEEGTCL